MHGVQKHESDEDLRLTEAALAPRVEQARLTERLHLHDTTRHDIATLSRLAARLHVNDPQSGRSQANTFGGLTLPFPPFPVLFPHPSLPPLPSTFR